MVNSEVTQSDDPHSCGIGLALSGGGSRAIAFHLGCLRALHEAGILERVDVISAVSGGSVIAAMYVYSDDSFGSFDKRVCELLRKGIQGNILSRFLRLDLLFGSICTTLIAGTCAVLVDSARTVMTALWKKFAKTRGQMPAWLAKMYSPIPRWVSRTNALERILDQRVFNDIRMESVRRNNMDIVINACELRTATAFRFGSRESSSWRFGKIDGNDVKVSRAVAASAAYPILLPALDVEFLFELKSGDKERKRVVLTDGGIYDNLGTTCLEPGRSADFTFNVFHPKHIVCCYAGHGQLDDAGVPYWWPSRQIRVTGATFKRAQDASMGRLHEFVKHGEIDSFVLAYLGQQDSKLLDLPSDFVPREKVASYPTDFAPMTEEDIRLLTSRGEQLTRLHLSRYAQKLLKE
ncbi:MAG TPA: patatin-like phospholipase family protein [Oculatellaceae cyanobacterium]